MRKSIQHFFRNFDVFSSPATLRSKQKPQTTNPCTGFISFLLGCFFAFIFLQKLYQAWNHRAITSSHSFEMVNPKKPFANDILFGISLDMNITEINQYFHIYAIPMTNGHLYNQIIQFQPCSPRQWSRLGKNYLNQFTNSSLNNFLCPVSTNSLRMRRSQFMQGFNGIHVMIQPCTLNSCLKKMRPPYNCNCRSPAEIDQFILSQVQRKGYVGVWVNFLDQAVQQQFQDPAHHFVNSDVFLTFTRTQGQIAKIQFGNFIVNTDKSIWPTQKNVTKQGYFLDNKRYVQRKLTHFGDQYARIQISMGRKLHVYSRKIGKLSDILSSIGGLFSLLVTFLGFFLYSFNQFRYELKVAQRSFTYDKYGHKQRQSRFTFWKYIKYSIYDWCHFLFGIKPQISQCKQIDQTRTQILKQMDVTYLYDKLQQFHTNFTYLMDNNERICLSLAQAPSLNSVRKQRLITQYYDAVIQNQKMRDQQRYAIKLKNICKQASYLSNQSETDNIENQQQANIYQVHELFNQQSQDQQANPFLTVLKNRSAQSEQPLIQKQVKLAKKQKKKRLIQQIKQVVTPVINPDPSVQPMSPSTTIPSVSFNPHINVKPNQNIQTRIEKALDKYPQIREQALKLVLSDQLKQTQEYLVNCFMSMSPQSQMKIGKRIPIKILHRLFKTKQLMQEREAAKLK